MAPCIQFLIFVAVTSIILPINCTDHSPHQQVFRKRPIDVYPKLGDEVILECEIDNLGGRVQWAKDGFVLGFNRKIPGFGGRYSVIGDNKLGVFNLNIKNVSIWDEADYQCQVGPSVGMKSLMSSASLRVLGPAAPQQYVGVPVDTVVSNGDSVILICAIERMTGYCFWEKDYTSTLMFPGKYEWAGNLETGNCSLLIRNATVGIDDGQWVCKVTASDHRDIDSLSSQPVDLVVRQPLSTTATFGDSLEDVCKDDNPICKISRYYDGGDSWVNGYEISYEPQESNSLDEGHVGCTHLLGESNTYIFFQRLLCQFNT